MEGLAQGENFEGKEASQEKGNNAEGRDGKYKMNTIFLSVFAFHINSSQNVNIM